MKLHASSTQQYQTVTGYDATGVEINAEHFGYSLIVMPETAPRAWDVTRFEDLTEAHFTRLIETQPELVIFGSGARLRFPPPALLSALMARRIGVETMDTLAACRTYNILAGEGRRVTAALLIETGLI